MSSKLNWSISTITFRHRLCSINYLREVASYCRLKGIELWELHWLNAEEDLKTWHLNYSVPRLVALSGYLDLTDFSRQGGDWHLDLERKLQACEMLDIPVLRLFTGTIPSTNASKSVWIRFFERLRLIQKSADQRGVNVAFETHPLTLLDSESGVEQLVAAICTNGWDRIGINFDAFHVWEFANSPLSCLSRWYPYVKHVHFKNAFRKTSNFAAGNVFCPNGNFADLAPLSDGVVNIAELVQFLFGRNYIGAVTLEWFGRPDAEFLKEEVQFLDRCCRAGIEPHNEGLPLYQI